MTARRPTARTTAAVALGGAAGTLLRYAAGQLWPGPAGTLAINVLGGLAIGALLRRPAGRPDRYLRPLLATGLLGGFTTFSGYAVDVRALLLAGRPGPAVAYLLGTVALVLAATWCGHTAAGWRR
ncbi:hypothetical protein GCM10010123_16770 [Pilimelia anulata]|uniref:Fluoride-specific ion channel FluC n=1 Tax=Pilimelia anulata TaxID=53371 RepID=A0A8J3B926_9ACTN|nr:CrcB family protein [Pilimelia anulata]GGJ87842.1 hypothetical protein GCM10010123_16770 [Pilimelia anulata]